MKQQADFGSQAREFASKLSKASNRTINQGRHYLLGHDSGGRRHWWAVELLQKSGRSDSTAANVATTPSLCWGAAEGGGGGGGALAGPGPIVEERQDHAYQSQGPYAHSVCNYRPLRAQHPLDV